MAPGGRSWRFFLSTGGAGDIHNSISVLNYCDKPYGDLGMYVTNVPSAWIEVWVWNLLSRAH